MLFDPAGVGELAPLTILAFCPAIRPGGLTGIAETGRLPPRLPACIDQSLSKNNPRLRIARPIVTCTFAQERHYSAQTANSGPGGNCTMDATVTAADTTLDTFPKYLLLNAKRFSDRPAMRHKDYGIWQSWDVERTAGRGPCAGRRSSVPGRAAWRQGGHRRRQPAKALLEFRFDPVAGGRSGSHVCRFGGRGDGLCPGSRRGQIRHRAGPGAGRQDRLRS